MSKIIVVGHLGKDADLKVLDSGRNVFNFSIAETKKIKKEGEVLENTQWFNVSFFTNSDRVLEFLKKGVKVLVIGELDIDVMKSEKTGKIYANVNIATSEVQILTFVDKIEAQTDTEKVGNPDLENLEAGLHF
jgi:single-strand DNA-binding protein